MRPNLAAGMLFVFHAKEWKLRLKYDSVFDA